MASENQERSKNSVVCMQSELLSHEGELVWSVSGLSQLKQSSIVSNEFSVNPCCKIEWDILLHLGNDVETTDIEIRRKGVAQKPFKATIQCSFENSKGEAYKYDLFQGLYPNTNVVPGRLPRVLQGTSDLEWNFTNCSLDDILIVRCQIKLKNCCITTKTIEKGEYKTGLPRSIYSMDFIKGFKRLYTERLWADIEIKVGETTFPAHKYILCVRSPVLQNMLESDMLESRSGVINIADAQPKIVEAFLSYLYTDSIDELSIEEIHALYGVANKYEVRSLQDKCSSVLKENLNDKTVCQTLKLAHLHNDGILKEAASKYVGAHFPTLQHTPEFKSLRNDDTDLVLDIILANSTLLNTTAPNQVGAVSLNSTVSSFPRPYVFPPVGFGATSNTSDLFGSATISTHSSGSTIFGSFDNNSTSTLGTPPPLFGGVNASTPGTGLVGQSVAGMFGSPGGFTATAATGGTTIKLIPPTGTDRIIEGGVATNIDTRYQCITAMREYEDKSLEELRAEDYVANRKDGTLYPLTDDDSP